MIKMKSYKNSLVAPRLDCPNLRALGLNPGLANSIPLKLPNHALATSNTRDAH